MTQVAAPLRAIETQYRGYRMRSRLEARYAVVFDAAGIDWRYEAEGFALNGTRYLPDFFLPELNTYVEVKPNKAAAQQAAPLLWALKETSGADALFAIDSPTIEPPGNFFTCYKTGGGGFNISGRAHVKQCPFCDRISFGYYGSCPCTDVRVLRAPYRTALRLTHALGEAQRARFEFGESGRPRPYTRPPAKRTRVYVAGAIFDEGDPTDDCCTIAPWRSKIFHCDNRELREYANTAAGNFIYAGPSIVDNHGSAVEDLADECLAEVADADTLFVWIDDYDTLGTLVEIGAAHAASKPIFVAFAAEYLAKHFYFVEQLADFAVVAADVLEAWALFARVRP